MSTHPPNRLADETSPYLLQHAHNPVDWFPWGDEAFAAARERNVPIFLSVGYSACHWCHVMERESFEHDQIAALMNQWFVNVKVDREERPDVDQIYMTAVQLVTGQGGWPMSVFLAPTGEPFYGGTYWPPTSRHGMPGFADILQKIHQYWEEHRDECLAKGAELVTAIDQLHHHEQEKSPLQEDLLRHAQHRLMQSADMQEGGFGHAPKFPHPSDLRVLLRSWRRFGQVESRNVVTLTLDKMADGGIYDHLAGGFARYATDRFWLVPHFEKMLYDNSQLATVYLEGYQATGNDRYAEVVRETLDFVLRDMTSPEHGFYSTLDADSEGVEGKFYVWSEAEVDELLEAKAAEWFKHVYNVSAEGNWEGHNILHRTKPLQELAGELGTDRETLSASLTQSREVLLKVREQRIWPGRDEKIIVAWNGLMLSAFAQAGRILGDDRYTQAACKAADFLLSTLRRDNGSLWHCRKDGRNRFNGFLDDYACLIDGLNDLYLTTLEPKYLQEALSLTDVMQRLFYDDDQKAFHYTPSDHEELVVRVRDRYDSAIPSGTNLAIHALLKLGWIVGREDYVTRAGDCLDNVSGTMRQQPSGMGQAHVALDLLLGPTEEFILCGEDVAETATQLQREFAPRRLLFTPSEAQLEQPGQSPLLSGKSAQNGQPTLYVCQKGACQQPLIGDETIRAHLESSTL
ncbi:thioredoxin domain-containing protein [Rubinisphaera sp. JC750]|uniref:thioredoxin domain-containing protein n=1 Tax=Rubinisphaera sp. JC750 TaxID=2898658 RepID=UPI001F26F7FE|nr:thioredoxin domain-containing protein [Rubinisphaera sp. JC750]